MIARRNLPLQEKYNTFNRQFRKKFPIHYLITSGPRCYFLGDGFRLQWKELHFRKAILMWPAIPQIIIQNYRVERYFLAKKRIPRIPQIT